MGIDTGKQWEYTCSGSVQRCWLNSSIIVRCKQWGLFDRIEDYRINGRTRGLQFGMQFECKFGYLDLFGLDG